MTRIRFSPATLGRSTRRPPYTLLRTAALLAAFATTPPVAATADGEADPETHLAAALQRWEESPHGAWLARILPPSKTPATLPDPASPGARLAVRYCVQCHHLPNPAMHHADKWRKVLDRMVPRMRGEGNMGALMKNMMGDVLAPTEEEVHVLLEYLQAHSQRAIDPALYPDLATRGRAFRDACDQCHALPDPRSRRAADWPAIVERMERNMQWMNRVVGSRRDAREPELRVPDILDYLTRHAPRR